MTQEIIEAEFHYVDKLLNIIENVDDFTQSDLQGTLQALVKRIARDKNLLTFEERLSLSKEQDLY